MKFSIIVPLYNKAAYVRRTLESALAQTLADFEIIVVNDGSTDRGAEIVAALDDSRIRLLHQANAGVSAARNHGIREARGEWIAFLDADDWQHPEYLATLHQLIAQFPAVDVVATHYRSIPHRDGEAIDPWPVGPGTGNVELVSDLPARWMRGTSLYTGSIAARSALLQTMQPCFPVGESAGEDLDLWFRLGEISPIALSSQALTARVWVPDGLSELHRPTLEPPFLLRMAQRARSGRLPPKLADSSLRLVDEARISLARSGIAKGGRRSAFGLLWRGRHGARSPRWWITLGMALMLPGNLVAHWQHWRTRRKMVC